LRESTTVHLQRIGRLNDLAHNHFRATEAVWDFYFELLASCERLLCMA
jgi:hypothetical protein